MADNKQSTQTSKSSQSPTQASIRREKRLDASKYNIENLHYPIDLFSNAPSSVSKANKSDFFNQQYLNYVVFYINVSDQSRVFTDGKAEVVGDVDKADQNTIQGKQASVASAATTAGVGGAAVGTVVGTAEGASKNAGALGPKGGGTATFLKGVLGNTVGGAVKGGAVTGGSVAAGGASLNLATGVSATNKIKRLKTAIALHVPNEVSVGYRATYGEEELGAIFGAAGEAATNQNLGNAGAGMQGAVMKGMEVNPAKGLLSALYKAAPNRSEEHTSELQSH